MKIEMEMAPTKILQKQLCAEIETKSKNSATDSRFFDQVNYYGPDCRMNRLMKKYGSGRWLSQWTGPGRIMGYQKPKIHIEGWW